jgi:hypothetical protein
VGCDVVWWIGNNLSEKPGDFILNSSSMKIVLAQCYASLLSWIYEYIVGENLKWPTI